MFRLPECVFNNMCSYVPPKTLFASKRVSKKWGSWLSTPSLWKIVAKTHHPDFANSIDAHEKFICDLTKVEASSHLPSFDCFEFTFVVYENSKKVKALHWKGGNFPSLDDGDWKVDNFQSLTGKLYVRYKSTFRIFHAIGSVFDKDFMYFQFGSNEEFYLEIWGLDSTEQARIRL